MVENRHPSTRNHCKVDIIHFYSVLISKTKSVCRNFDLKNSDSDDDDKGCVTKYGS